MAPRFLAARTREDRRQGQPRNELVSEAMERYVEWREACAAVESAYENWSSAPAGVAELPFVAYSAALDREQSAASVYRRALDLLAEAC